MKTKQTYQNKQSKKSPTQDIRVILPFKSIDAEFKISASPEAWLKLEEKCFDSPEAYHYQRKGLFKDMWPFISAAYVKAQHWTQGEGKKLFQKALYVQAAIIHDLTRARCINDNREKKETDLWEYTFQLFYSIWKEDTENIKRKKGDQQKTKKDPITIFAKQYINGGRKLMSGNKEELGQLLSALLAFFSQMKERKFSGYKNNKRFQIVYDMTLAVEALVSGRGEDQFISSILPAEYEVIEPCTISEKGKKKHLKLGIHELYSNNAIPLMRENKIKPRESAGIRRDFLGVLAIIPLAREAYPFLK